MSLRCSLALISSHSHPEKYLPYFSAKSLFKTRGKKIENKSPRQRPLLRVPRAWEAEAGVRREEPLPPRAEGIKEKSEEKREEEEEEGEERKAGKSVVWLSPQPWSPYLQAWTHNPFGARLCRLLLQSGGKFSRHALWSGKVVPESEVHDYRMSCHGQRVLLQWTGPLKKGEEKNAASLLAALRPSYSESEVREWRYAENEARVAQSSAHSWAEYSSEWARKTREKSIWGDMETDKNMTAALGSAMLQYCWRPEAVKFLLVGGERSVGVQLAVTFAPLLNYSLVLSPSLSPLLLTSFFSSAVPFAPVQVYVPSEKATFGRTETFFALELSESCHLPSLLQARLLRARFFRAIRSEGSFGYYASVSLLDSSLLLHWQQGSDYPPNNFNRSLSVQRALLALLQPVILDWPKVFEGWLNDLSHLVRSPAYHFDRLDLLSRGVHLSADADFLPADTCLIQPDRTTLAVTHMTASNHH